MTTWTEDDLKAVIASNPDIRILDTALTAQAKQQAAANAREQKYNARKATYDGHKFDSLAERNRYLQLVSQQQAGEISELVVHPQYELLAAFDHFGERVRAITYKPDFRYKERGRIVVEDVKSPATAARADYQLRVKLFKHRYRDIEFREVGGKKPARRAA